MLNLQKEYMKVRYHKLQYNPILNHAQINFKNYDLTFAKKGE